jgi:uncharacterized protein
MPSAASSADRIQAVDALRGLALFGILMVNVWFFADSTTVVGGPDPDATAPIDLAIRFGVATLFEGKFYLLYSLLFGYGFAVLQRRSGPEAVHLIRRRLAFLAVLGIVHGLALFYGDILLTYALAGTILLATRTITARTALGIAVAITAGVFLLLIGSAALLLLGDAAGGTAPTITTVMDPWSPIEAFRHNAGTYGTILPTVVFFQGPLALAAFFAGSSLAARGVLRPHAPSRAVLRRVVVLALPLGLTASACQAYLGIWGANDGTSLLATGLSVAASPLVTIGYGAAFLLLLDTRRGSTVSALLAPAGRLSLTNYLGQSVALCGVFTGYGFGLADELPSALVVLLVIVLFAAQIVTSRLILARWSTGPLEWALRSVVHRSPGRTPGED